MADAPEFGTAQRPGTPRWVIAIGIALVAAIVLAVVVMVVSGGQHGPSMHTGTGAMSPPPSSNSTGTAGAVGEPGDAGQASRTIQVSALDSMAFEPASLSVAPGEVVTFVVTNGGQADHEFTLGDAAMQKEHAATMGHMPEGIAHALPNSIALAPGETKELTWRFAQGGTLEYACHEPGHYEAGMRGQLTVQ